MRQNQYFISQHPIRTTSRFREALPRYQRYRIPRYARFQVMWARVRVHTRKGGNGQKGRDDG